MNSESTPDAPHDVPPVPRTFQMRRIAVLVITVLAVFAGLIAFFGFFDGIDWLQSLALPRLVPAKGTVMIGTRPLSSGQVLTEPVNGRSRGSLGIIDANGQFTLRTDVDGTFVDGAYIGKHKVLLVAPRPAERYGVGIPPSLVAAKYTSLATTPLIVTVSRNSADNVFSIIVEASEQQSADATAEKQESEAKAETPATNPGAMALRQRLSSVDADRDGKLTRDELINGKVDVEKHFAEIDADNSGAIERNEMDQLVKFLLEAATRKSP